MVRRREVLVFTKDVNGGIASLLEQLTRIKSSELHLSLFLYRKKDINVFDGRVQCVNEYYPDDRSASLKKILLLVQNIQRTYILLKNVSGSTKILACDMYSALLLLLLKLTFIRNIPVICLVNSNFQKIIAKKSNVVYRFLLERIVVSLYRHADCIIYVSYDLAEASNRFLGISSHKCIIIPNGISRTVINEKASTEINDADLYKMKADSSFKVVSIGRLEPQKDFQTLISAFAKVHNRHKDCNLYIIGDGLLRADLEQLSINLKLSKKIHFLGWKQNVYPFYKEADIFVLSSHYEGFGRVILEAMACGIPVVSSDVEYGPSEILCKGEFGLLTPEGDERMMANCILSLITDKSLRDKFVEKAYRRVDAFSEKEMMEKYRRLFLD